MIINYTLIRSNRKSIGIMVKDGKVSVCVPHAAKDADIEKFLISKSKWIEEKLNIYNKKSEKLNEFLLYQKFLYFGNTISPEFCNVKKMSIDNSKLLIPQKFDIKDLKISENIKLLNAIYKFFALDAFEKLNSILKQVSSKFNIPYNTFDITNAKSKWGSCDGKNNILLNWRLVFFSIETIEYVAIHESAHTIEHNHSAAFWVKVWQCDNAYKIHKHNLKDLSLLISIFR